MFPVHQFGPWRFVLVAAPLPHGDGFMWTFSRFHASAPQTAVDILRGFGKTEQQGARDAASCLVDADGLPLVR